MDRLTFSTKKYGAGLWDCPNFSCGEICRKKDCRTCPIQKAFDRLAYYEDAEEQGKLLIMPCEIDSYLYAIIYDDSFHTYDVSKHPIVDFCFSGAIITDARIGDPNCEILTPEDQEEYHVCFSEKEAEKKAVELLQAEAKLAELEEQNGQIDKT